VRGLGCVAVALVALLLSGCGGSGTSTTVLEPTNPVLSGLYVSITAPSPVAGYIAHWALGGSSGTIIVSKPQGLQVCSRRTKITEAMIQYRVAPAETATLSKNIGQPFTIALYGTSPEIPNLCKALGAS